MKSGVSVVISAFNEEKKIGRTLESVSWADQIVVVDNQSYDKTKEIAFRYTKHVYSRPNDFMLNKNKNFGFEKATGAWILNLDADEVITPELKDEILTAVKDFDADLAVEGFWISRKNILFGKWMRHGYWWPDKQLRLFRNGKGRFPCRHIHEYIHVTGGTKVLREPYVHYNYETITQYIQKLDRCTTSEAIEYNRDGYVFSWKDSIRFPTSDFLKIYFAQKAYSDGFHGLILSLLQASYSFVTFAKLWELQKFPDSSMGFSDLNVEYRQATKQMKYWSLSAHIEQTRNPFVALFLRVVRKLLSV